jgi:L-asparaginase
MAVHLVSDGGQHWRSTPALLSISGVVPTEPLLLFRVIMLPIFRDRIMSLRIIATGGTFDKCYDPLTGNLIFETSILPAALERARITEPISFDPLLALDSLEMTDQHRAKILAACERSEENKIVIIHGTDTMRETAEVIGQAALQKTIVLTGAMVPYRVASSDALFNLGFAIAVAQLSGSGVFVAMNAQVFAWDSVRKNKAAGVFELNE